MKIKAAEEVSDHLFGGPRGQPLQVQQRAGVEIQRLQLVLRKIAKLQAFGAGAIAGGERKRAGKSLDQGRLARAIRPQQTHPHARLKFKIHRLQDGFFGVAQSHL